MAMKEKEYIVGVLGSAFNPPHLGHMDALRQALAGVDMVIAVPCAVHAFGKQMLPLAERARMLEIIIGDTFHGRDRERIRISHVEKILSAEKAGPVYTFDLLERLEKLEGPNKKLRFIVGPDNASGDTWCRFHRHTEIEQRWGLFVAREEVVVRSTTVRSVLEQPAESREALVGRLAPLTGQRLAAYMAERRK